MKFLVLLFLPFSLWGISFGSSAEPLFPQTDRPAGRLFVGERLLYRVQYFGIPLGEGESEIKEIVEINGRKAYHIIVRVRSYPAIDLLYKVRDEHHTYIDVRHLYSLRYEKKLSEGAHRVMEVMEYHHKSKTGTYRVPDAGIEKHFEIPENVQDQLSCGFWFRTADIRPHSTVIIPTNADGENWDFEVKVKDTEEMEIDGIGRFTAIEVEPLMRFQGIFIRHGKIKGWMSLDERRLPLKMKVKIPVFGSITAVLKEYVPGTDTHAEASAQTALL